MAAKAELRGLLCQGRPYCKQLADLGKLTARRVMVWTQEQVQNLKEGWRTTRRVLVSGLARLLWDQEVSRQVDVTISKQGVSRRIGTVI